MPNVNDKPDVLLNVPGVVDTKHEEEGEWFGHAPDPESDEKIRPNQIDGFQHLLLDKNGNGLRRVLVRSRYTKNYQKDETRLQTMAARMKPNKRNSFLRKSVSELAAMHCVADWEFTDRTGGAIPFSQDLAARLMSEPQFRHHAAFITIAIATLQGDLEQIVEDDRGN